MYKALKSAQSEIQETLLKFADEVSVQKVDTSKCPRGDPCQSALITQSVPSQQSQVPSLESIQKNLEFLHSKQNAQYEVLVEGIQSLNSNLSSIVKLLSEQTRTAVESATTIPNLQPVAQGSDLKDVCVNKEQVLETPHEEESAIDGDITPDIDVEEEDAAIEEEDEGVEVEPWMYKGIDFFKDSENTVYANVDGEIGDIVGHYDPVKKVVKKAPSN